MLTIKPAASKPSKLTIAVTMFAPGCGCCSHYSIMAKHSLDNAHCSSTASIVPAWAKKKPADLAVAGLNPIQGELEETGIIILQRSNEGLFIVVMTDIHNEYN